MRGAGRWIGNELSAEEFQELRTAGWSYKRIAERIGFSPTTVQKYGKAVLPEELRRSVAWRQRSPVGDRVVELLEAGWDERGTAEIAAELGCHRTTVQVWKRKWLADGEAGRGSDQCLWCGILGEDMNPIEEGRCLWCRVEAAGWRVIDWLEAGGMGILGIRD